MRKKEELRLELLGLEGKLELIWESGGKVWVGEGRDEGVVIMEERGSLEVCRYESKKCV